MKTNEDRLHAYVDDMLSAGERADVEAWLAADPAARARADAYRSQNAALHRAFDGVLDEPHSLHVGYGAADAVGDTPANENARGRARAAARVPPFFARLRQGTRKGLALAATLVLGIAIGYSAAQPWRSGGNVAVRAPLARQAALAHAAYRPEVRHAIEVEAADEQHLVAWLSKRLTAPLRPPQLTSAGFRLLGGRLLPATNDANRPPVALLMYEDGGGRRLSLLVRRDDGGTDTAFRFVQDGGTQVFYWVDRPFGYALAGDLTRDELMPLAQLVYRQLNP